MILRSREEKKSKNKRQLTKSLEVETPIKNNHKTYSSVTHLLDVDLNVLLLVVLVQVHDEIADQVEAITHNNEGKLVGQLGLL